MPTGPSSVDLPGSAVRVPVQHPTRRHSPITHQEGVKNRRPFSGMDAIRRPLVRSSLVALSFTDLVLGAFFCTRYLSLVRCRTYEPRSFQQPWTSLFREHRNKLKMGLTCYIVKIHSEALNKNAKKIKEYIEEMYWGSKKQVLLLGLSKGGVDVAAALPMYWDELKDKVAGLALAQSPYGGSPIASDILREGQLGVFEDMEKA
ncbi:hypothetical protein Salat_1167500 [Sesamum alatum]|uniref:Uncharacterized protein n=1 Tax=Sesamum alatum TaxID=300844 RepID=A0AAE1YEN1_9LAMI|nr:hypothetical protein Salat_1167500 [Sesamum alatum]